MWCDFSKAKSSLYGHLHLSKGLCVCDLANGEDFLGQVKEQAVEYMSRIKKEEYGNSRLTTLGIKGDIGGTQTAMKS